MLGQEHGFATLSLAMIVLGISVLGDLNNAARDQKAIGMPFWRIILSAGILAMIMGVVNLVSVRSFNKHGCVVCTHRLTHVIRTSSSETMRKALQLAKFGPMEQSHRTKSPVERLVKSRSSLV